MKREEKIILALDVDTFARAKYFINLLYPKIKIFKVGSQLFTGCGPKATEFIHKKGGEVCLDLKYFDIPHTVARAVAQAARLKVKMLTLHISGGAPMIQAAVEAVKKIKKNQRPLLIGVTVLTSKAASRQKILALAKEGLTNGLDGVVCSARETKFLREKLGSKFIIITPGIRPKSGTQDDQKRVATGQDALKAGSSFLVIGRPILEAADPLMALRQLWGENYVRRY